METNNSPLQAALSQEVVNTSNTVTKTSDYVGAFHYENGDLIFLQREEGRVRLDGSDWVYEYQLTDHLGNVRVTFGDLNDDGILDPNTEIQDANDYYACICPSRPLRPAHGRRKLPRGFAGECVSL
ncbi:MAG: hypothetical protein SF052_17280 [Bacteroidia bacterium]|nr:hypothetical protein [Bacteroidia bacterium]